MAATTIGHIETHGTGTGLGDPVEASGIANVFASNHHKLTNLMSLSAVKSHIAHTEAAAGGMGLLLVALTMSAGCCPPNMHLNQLNPKLPTEGEWAFLMTEMTHASAETETGGVGLSSFGMSGTNAHVIVTWQGDAGAPSLTPMNSAMYKATSFKWWTQSRPSVNMAKADTALPAEAELEIAPVVATQAQPLKPLKQIATAVPSTISPKSDVSTPTAADQKVVKGVRQVLTDILPKFDTDTDDNEPFKKLAVDSLSFIEVINSLSEHFDLEIAMTAFSEQSTVKTIATYVQTLLDAGGPVQPPAAVQQSHSPARKNKLAGTALLGANKAHLQGLAASIQSQASEGGLLFSLQEGDPNEDPIVVIYAAGGGAYGTGMLKHLEGIPVYGTQAPEFTTKTTFSSLVSRATHHAAALSNVFKGQCVHLVGYSAGAALAAEIAAKMAAGTCTLTLFDPIPASLDASRFVISEPLLDRAKAFDIILGFVGPDPELRTRVANKEINDDFNLDIEVYKLCNNDMDVATKIRMMAAYFVQSASEFEGFQKSADHKVVIPLDVAVIVGVDGLTWFIEHSPYKPDMVATSDSAHGWSRRFRSVQPTMVEGDHITIWNFESNVTVLARHLLSLRRVLVQQHSGNNTSIRTDGSLALVDRVSLLEQQLFGKVQHGELTDRISNLNHMLNKE
jgi:thioesterase domain-containing protein/acyl carrier protein